MKRIVYINGCKECPFWLVAKWTGLWQCPVDGHEVMTGPEDLYNKCPLDVVKEESNES